MSTFLFGFICGAAAGVIGTAVVCLVVLPFAEYLKHGSPIG